MNQSDLRIVDMINNVKDDNPTPAFNAAKQEDNFFVKVKSKKVVISKTMEL